MIKLGFIGTSAIAEKFAEAAALTGFYEFEAVYSRKKETAETFCQKVPFKKIYTDLNELADDASVDAVYIASPNSLHEPQAMLMLTHKKHVICEKPMVTCAEQCHTLLETAKQHGVILLEAMRPAFDPAYTAIQEALYKLGAIRRVSFSFCQYSSRYDNFKKGIVANVFNPDMGGGSMLDIGIYPIHMLAFLFGRPKLCGCMNFHLNNGVDGLGEIIAAYDDFLAEISYSKITNSFVPSRIEGEAGYMTIDTVAHPTEVIITYNDKHTETVYKASAINNMVYEAEAFYKMIQGELSAARWHKSCVDAIEIVKMALENERHL